MFLRVKVSNPPGNRKDMVESKGGHNKIITALNTQLGCGEKDPIGKIDIQNSA